MFKKIIIKWLGIDKLKTEDIKSTINNSDGESTQYNINIRLHSRIDSIIDYLNLKEEKYVVETWCEDRIETRLVKNKKSKNKNDKKN